MTMSKEAIKKINKLAEDIADARDKAGEFSFSICPEKISELYTLLVNNYKPENFSIAKEETFYKAFYESMRKFTPGGKDSFDVYFSKLLSLRTKDEYRKNKNKQHLNISFNIQSADNGKNSAQNELGDMIADNLESIEWFAELESYFIHIATICIAKKKDYFKSSRVCYPPLFFTNEVVYNILNTDRFCEIIQRQANKFDEAASHDFLNTLITSPCDSVMEFQNFDCRPLSDFTGNEKDAKTHCCEQEPNYHVFNRYLKSAVGKEISQAAFGMQRDKYYDLLEGRLGISRSRKKKKT